MDRFFPIGVDYGGTLPRAEWEDDIRQIADAGFNCIRVEVGWLADEDLDYLLQLAARHKLKVIAALLHLFPTDFQYASKEFMEFHEDQCRKAAARLNPVEAIVAWNIQSAHAGVWKDLADLLTSAIRSIDQSRPIVENTLQSWYAVQGPVSTCPRASYIPSAPSLALRQEEQLIGLYMRMARIMSGGVDVWATSLQGGPSERWIDYQPRDVGLSAWSAIAHGAKGLIYGLWEESTVAAYSYIRSLEGKLWPGLKRISLDIRKLLELPGFSSMRPSGSVAAILTSPILVDQEVKGAYRLLADNLVSVGFISTRDEIALNDLRKYRIVYVPELNMCSPQLAETLKEYVRSGGNLIAETLTAARDDARNPYPEAPGGGLSEVFGCKWKAKPSDVIDKAGKIPHRYGDTRPVATTSIAQGVFTTVGANSRFYLEGPTVDMDVEPGRSAILDFLDPHTLRPTGPAAVIGKFGEGKTAFIAGSLSNTYLKTENAHARELISGILDWFETPRQVEMTGLTKGFENRVQIVVMEGLDEDNRRAIICLNHSEATLHPTLSLPAGAPSVVCELMTGEEIPFDVEDGRISLGTHLPEREVRVYYESKPR